MIAGTLLVIIGWLLYCLGRKYQAPGRAALAAMEELLRMERERHDLEIRVLTSQFELAEKRKIVALGFDHKPGNKTEPASDDLNEIRELVTQDALRREVRAKAALVAVLQQQGCSQEQVDEVLRKVDNDPA